MVTERLFGTDGVRGLANVGFMAPDKILQLGQAIGLYFKKRAHTTTRVLIGKDTRRSGYMLEQALCSGICSVGADAFFVGPIPTPGIAYLTRGMRASAGIMISASHNPYQDNGIKIFNGDGYKLPDSIEDEIESLMINSRQLLKNAPIGEGIGTAKRIEDAKGQYAVFLKEQFPKHLTLEGIKIVVDCAHGAAYKVAPKVFWELGAEVVLLGDEPNGTNINENCGALHPEVLQRKVTEHKADLGIALDGDADRLLLVDHRGEVIDGDEILAICGGYLSKQGRLKRNSVVSTIMSNMGLDVSLQKVGAKLIRTKVGDRYVMEQMVEGDYSLGGEQSGHLIFKDSSTTGDGILAGLKVLEVLINSGETLHDLKKCMHKFPQVLKNVNVAEKIPLERLPKFKALVDHYEKELSNRGRVSFRYSGTERLARIMVEGEDSDQIKKISDDLIEALSKSISECSVHD